MNPVLGSGIIFLVVGLGIQVYDLGQIATCIYASPPVTSCNGPSVVANSISLFLILVGLVAIVRARRGKPGPLFATASSKPSA